jgi:flagellar basal body rod protein FlgG
MKRFVCVICAVVLSGSVAYCEQDVDEQEKKIQDAINKEPALMRLLKENPEFGKVLPDNEKPPLGEFAQQPSLPIVPKHTDTQRTTQFTAFVRNDLSRIDRQIWNVLHNLSHSKTYGYKTIWYEFPSPLPNFAADSERVTVADNSGSVAILIDTRSGVLTKTGHQFDIAISGQGFLKIQKPNSNTFLYTRNGQLTLDSKNQLSVLWYVQTVKPDNAIETGYAVPIQPVIKIPDETKIIKITPKGNVLAKDKNGNDISVGQIGITTFPQPQRLQPIDARFYTETPDAGKPSEATQATILQYHLEESNANTEQLHQEIIRLREIRTLYLSLLE